MAIELPPELSWVAYLTGQPFPKGNETQMFAMGDVWNSTAKQLADMGTQLDDVESKVFEGLSGPPAEQFAQYASELRTVFPELAAGANQLGGFAHDTALQIEYAKYMIIITLIWMAEQIATWASTLWGAVVVPEIEMAGAMAVRAILRQLLVSVVSGTVINTGMDVLVQAIQFLKGDRTHWDTRLTKGAVEGGAVFGVTAGLVHGGAKLVFPKLFDNAIGHIGVGATGGLLGGEVTNLALNSDQNLGLATAAGAFGGLMGSRTRGGEDIPAPDINLSGLKSLPDLDLGPGRNTPTDKTEDPTTTPGEHGQLPDWWRDNPANGTHSEPPVRTDGTGGSSSGPNRLRKNPPGSTGDPLVKEPSGGGDVRTPDREPSRVGRPSPQEQVAQWQSVRQDMSQQYANRFDYETKLADAQRHGDFAVTEAIADHQVAQSRSGSGSTVSPGVQDKTYTAVRDQIHTAFENRFGTGGSQWQPGQDHAQQFQPALDKIVAAIPDRISDEALWESQLPQIQHRFEQVYDNHPDITARRELLGPAGEPGHVAARDIAWQNFEKQARTGFESTIGKDSAVPVPTRLERGIQQQLDTVHSDISRDSFFQQELQKQTGFLSDLRRHPDLSGLPDQVWHGMHTELETRLRTDFGQLVHGGEDHTALFDSTRPGGSDVAGSIGDNGGDGPRPPGPGPGRDIFRDEAVRREWDRTSLDRLSTIRQAAARAAITYETRTRFDAGTAGLEQNRYRSDPALASEDAPASRLPTPRDQAVHDAATAFRNHFAASDVDNGRTWRSWNPRFDTGMNTQIAHETRFEQALNETRRHFDTTADQFDIADLGLEPEAIARVRADYEKDLRAVFDEIHRAAAGSWDGHGGGQTVWDIARQHLADGLPDRFRVEAGAIDALRDGAARFNAIRAGFSLPEDRQDILAQDFKADTARTFHEIFSSHKHDISAWLTHEEKHSNTFRTALDKTSTSTDYKPEPGGPAERTPEPRPGTVRTLDHVQQQIAHDTAAAARRWATDERRHSEEDIEAAKKAFDDAVRREFAKARSRAEQTGHGEVSTLTWDRGYQRLADHLDTYLAVEEHRSETMRKLDTTIGERLETWTEPRFAPWERQQLRLVHERLTHDITGEYRGRQEKLSLGMAYQDHTLPSQDTRMRWVQGAVEEHIDQTLQDWRGRADTSPAVIDALVHLHRDLHS
ncbi:hypothetical protein KGQ20_43615, partial [Catenulispora sp. NF23]|uniref:WXG100-like domain-containing protein n=1 Tax=Catenulispora pinistramenti TaxID=2705254 RepID=UPI001BA610E0